MQALAEKISRYIEYLRSVSLSVSIHFSPDVTARFPYAVWQVLLPYNSHSNPYCLSVKSCSAEKCIAHQRAIQSNGNGDPRLVCCYAGVLEYIHPMKSGDKIAGYIAVSGYLGDEAKILNSSRAWAALLMKTEVEKELCDTLVSPLTIMLSSLIHSSEKLENSEHNLMSQYLAENHTSIDFDNFCRHFSRSRSYMSHKFAKIFGMSFSSYCNRLRLEDARCLLLMTEQSISDIALSSGFGDVSYFIRLFKEHYGVSPLKYRKQETPTRCPD